MNLEVNGVSINIENFTNRSYEIIKNLMIENLQDVRIKNREVIFNAFKRAVALSPRANHSDLWHHIIYRLYTELILLHRVVANPSQSWVRSSGDALEMFICDYYNRMLEIHPIRLIPLTLNKKLQIRALRLLEIYGNVGDSKLDVAIMKVENLRLPIDLDNGTIVGGIHVKASLAERVSDDVPASVAMMGKGYKSYLITLDVKSFPLSFVMRNHDRAYINKGELGTSDNSTDKRKYIEEHGSFDACFSYNLRTFPSEGETLSGKRIYVGSFNQQHDRFYEELISLLFRGEN